MECAAGGVHPHNPGLVSARPQTASLESCSRHNETRPFVKLPADCAALGSVCSSASAGRLCQFSTCSQFHCVMLAPRSDSYWESLSLCLCVCVFKENKWDRNRRFTVLVYSPNSILPHLT